MILIKKILNLLKIKNLKIWRLSNTENNLKLSKAKFEVGDEVLIKNNDNEVGFILEVNIIPKLRGDSLDEFQYLVRLPYKYNKSYYFNEITLDCSLQKKRNDKLKELGI